MFAAYSQKTVEPPSKNEEQPVNKVDWLKNTSYVPVEEKVSEKIATPLPVVIRSPTPPASPARKRSKKHKKEKSKKKKKDHSKERTKDGKSKTHASQIIQQQVPALPKGAVFSNGHHLRPDQAFYEDKSGDRNNLGFPNLYYKNVARHFRTNMAIGGKALFIRKPGLEKKKPKPPRYFGKRAMTRLSKPVSTVSPQQPLPSASQANPLGIYDTSTVLYVQGRRAETEELSVVNQEADEIKRRTTLFNEKLRENPHDIQLWLAFIQFQDESSRFFSSGRPEQHLQALSERKMSILDKAIEQNPKSEQLAAARLHLAIEFKDAAALQQEWRNALFIHPTSIQMWKRYLHFSQSHFEGFTVQQALKAYVNCLQKLVQMQHPSFVAHQKPIHLDEQLIDIFVRLCRFLRESGWSEKAVALNQALLELGLKGSSLTAVQSLWDSRAPRFGEDGDKEKSIRRVLGNELTEKEDTIVSSGGAQPTVWHSVEALRSTEQWQPWTSSEEMEECDDPERSVPFTDLSSYLFLTERNPRVQFRLAVGCLQSLGVPILPASKAQLHWAPLEVEEDLLFSINKLPELFQLKGSALPTLLNSPSYVAFLRRIVVQSWTLLPDPYRLELALWWLDVERARSSHLAQRLNRIEFNRSWKETKSWIKGFLKIIPPSDLTATLCLYASYARVELEAGHPEESGRILQMLLQMNGSTNPLTQNRLSQAGKAALIHTWTCYIHSLLLNNRSTALAQLVALASGSPFSVDPGQPTPASLLKAKRKFQAMTQPEEEEEEKYSTATSHTGLFHQPDKELDLLFCYAYFLSLSEGLLPAYTLVHHWIGTNNKKEMKEEWNEPTNRFNPEFLSFHNRRESAYIRLLGLISASRDWVKDYEPRFHYDTLNQALSEYPDSAQILSVFVQSEERCSMFSGLWKKLTANAKNPGANREELNSCLVAIAASLALARREETIRAGEEVVATIHRGYRRKLEYLVEHCVLGQHPGRHLPILWRILMRSAHLQGDVKKCKTLFYRAARDCPWSKEICMDAVEQVPAILKEVAGLLAEKELRLRFPLEELDVLLEPEEAEEDEEEESTQDTKNVPAQDSEEEGNFSEDFEEDNVDEVGEDEVDPAC